MKSIIKFLPVALVLFTVGCGNLPAKDPSISPNGYDCSVEQTMIEGRIECNQPFGHAQGRRGDAMGR